MKALVKTQRGTGFMELQSAPIPEIERDEVLIKVHACGICGSDLKIHDDQHPYTPPVIVGHEFSGEIADLGVDVTDWAVGDRVVSFEAVQSLVLEFFLEQSAQFVAVGVAAGLQFRVDQFTVNRHLKTPTA